MISGAAFGDQVIDAPPVFNLGGEKQACRACGENGIVDGRNDTIRDAHGDGKTKGEPASGEGGPAGDSPRIRRGPAVASIKVATTARVSARL